MPYYTKQQIAELNDKLATVDRRAANLLLSFTYAPFKSEKAREYAIQGFSRRVSTVTKAIKNTFRIVPPTRAKIPSREKLYDAQINIQACVANLYGCVDNLAWIWVYEKGLDKNIARNRVGFRKGNKEVGSSLSPELQKYLDGIEVWMDYLTDFRDALGHRIPPYIPPGGVPRRRAETYNELMRGMNAALNRRDTAEYDRLSEEQGKLLVFQPMMTHSITEARGAVRFHVQMLADFATIEELGQKLLTDLGVKSTSIF